jgi:hypothetical protein
MTTKSHHRVRAALATIPHLPIAAAEASVNRHELDDAG